MISSREIANTATEWGLAHNVVEKDYALGWMLAGIAQHPVTRSWAFKGGTCLRKCWFETYRFSEDLDFTVPEADIDAFRLQSTFSEISEWVNSECGLRLVTDDGSFRLRRNKRGMPTIEGRIAYIGPLGMPTPPKVKLDLTADEAVVRDLELRPVAHPFGDRRTNGAAQQVAEVLCYSLPELLAEKLRALAERCRPRDLYDVVHIHRHPSLLGRDADVASILAAKCAHAGIEVPTLHSMLETPFRNEIEAEWSNMLGHQLPFLPPFDDFWSQLDEVFGWLSGSTPVPILEPYPVGDATPDWRPSRHMTTWQSGSPIELIRFAGANRLRVTLDYVASEGRIGPRTVEPYSFRRSRDGHLLLFVVNDLGELRSYRVDRIRGISVEPETFVPRYLVEF
ncbi:nucleotidyl transferase AbiEii/AbiGii toxin family protein [Candidatus Poriferisodalis sp.]|uniref:nucleotidyl transferase AbiEii/AbiGii toxin family protein n=1 Tax=Candidatus Poriferisodalis sp. TaxID=3101277 RepID=UPI003B029E65